MRAIITLILMHSCLQPARSEKTFNIYFIVSIFIILVKNHSYHRVRPIDSSCLFDTSKIEKQRRNVTSLYNPFRHILRIFLC